MCDVFTTVMDKDELKARETFTPEQTQTHLQVPIYTGSFSEGLQNNNDMDIMYQYPYALDVNIMPSDILKTKYTLEDDGSMVLVKKSEINYQYVTENVETSTCVPIPKQTEKSPTDLKTFVLMEDDHMVVTKEDDIPCQSLTKDDHKQLVFPKSKPDDKNPIVSTPKLFLVTEFSYPGHCFVYQETQTDDCLVLYDIKRATHLKEQTDIPVPVTRIHDWPATKTTAEVCNNLTSKDTVICLKCPIWPEGANGFFTRHRKHDWPTSKTLKAIKEKGLPHLVSKAHPYSEGAQADKEFRISTSLAGRMLVESMNDVQFKTYFLCKEIKPTEIEYQGRVYKNLITSYFIKTTIFWMCEEKEKRYWTRENLIQIVADVYNNLMTCLKHKSCPNYFIPENLMMSHFSETEVEAGLSALENITKHKFFKLPESVFLNKLGSHSGIFKQLDDMLPHEHIGYLERIVKTLNHEDMLQMEQNKILKERIFLFIWYMPFSLLDVVCRRQLMQYLKDVTVFLHEDVNEDKVVVTIIQRIVNRMLGYAHFITAKSLSTPESKHHFQQAEDLLLNTKLPDILAEPEISEKGQLLLFYHLSDNTEKCLHLCKHLQSTGVVDTICGSLMIHVWLTIPNSEYLETTFSSDETLLKCLRSGNIYIFPTALLHYVSYCLDLNKDISLKYLKKIVAELLSQYPRGYEGSQRRFYYSLVLNLRCQHNDFSESTRNKLDKMDRILKLIPDANKF